MFAELLLEALRVRLHAQNETISKVLPWTCDTAIAPTGSLRLLHR